MDIRTSRNDNHLLYWMAATLFLVGVSLADTATVAWSASLVSLWQLVASVLAFLLISTGVLFTVWQVRR